MRKKSANILQQAARNHHISTVLHLLKIRSSLSRAELSREIGLAKSSISSIIEEMLTLGLIHEHSPKADGVGKPSSQLTLNSQCRGAIGVEINPGFVAVVLTDLIGNSKWEAVTPLETGSVKERYLQSAEGLISLAIEAGQQQCLPILGVCVGVPGSVDLETGVIHSSSSLGWKEVPLRGQWQEKFHLPIIVDTEANLGAIGEHRFGCAQDIDTFLYINQSFGFRRSIGLAMMLNGKLWHGTVGRAGRIGHMVIDPDGPMCDCGQRGCWRVMASDEVELQSTIQELKEGRKSILGEYSKHNYEGLTVDVIHEAALQGDALARDVLKQRIEYTELAISNLINIFDPGVVVTAHSYTTVNRPEVDEIMKGLGTVVDDIMQTVKTNKNVERRHASHEKNAVLVGAASVLLSQFLNDPKGILTN